MQLVRQLLHILSRQGKEDEGQHSWRGQNPGFDAAVPLETVVTYKPPLCVPANLHRQRDWIRNRQGHTLLAVSVEMFPEVSLDQHLFLSPFCLQIQCLTAASPSCHRDFLATMDFSFLAWEPN